MILFPYILWLVAGEAWHEALLDREVTTAAKKKSKLIQSLWIASWFLLPLLVYGSSWKYLFIPLAYCLLRAGLFDIIYNAVYGHALNYQSHTTYLWDRLINKVKATGWLYILFVAVCVIAGFFILNWMV